MRRRPAGFTLAEMAIVLLVVGLLLGSVVSLVSTQLEARNIAETQSRLDQIKDALIGFAIVNGRLPCPATNTSAGVETPTGGICTYPHDGFVPARTLSFYPQSTSGFAVDAWNNPIRYAVSRVPTVHLTPTAWYDTFTTIPTTSAGIKYQVQTNGFAAAQLLPDLRVCSDATGITNAGTANAACAANKDITDTKSVVAIIYSVGKNFATVGAAGIDEAANWTPNPADPTKLTTLSRDRVFVSHTPTPAFDDLVVWIPVTTLFSRMIAAGTLP